MRPSQVAGMFVNMNIIELQREIEFMQTRTNGDFSEAIRHIRQCIEAERIGDMHAKRVASGQAAMAENRAWRE